MSCSHNYRDYAKSIIAIETQALENLQKEIPIEFDNACEVLRRTQGKIVVTGVGKSGHIAHKIAATLASTGSPALYMHPGEAGHGDLGLIDERDSLLALSFSGESTEILTFFPILKRKGTPIVSITGNAQSSMAQLSTVHLQINIIREACPLNLAPTSSTTVSLVLGDALALCLLKAKGFTQEDFAITHPSGQLGKRLITRVYDLMHQGERIAQVASEVNIANAIVEMTSKGLGMTSVVHSDGTLCGLFTDGDLRRTLEQQIDLHRTPIAQVMTPNCQVIDSNILATQALLLMEQKSINGFVVVDHNRHPIGMFNIHDLLRAGIV